MGDTIMVRSFAPLPRLDDITFLRTDTRDFVTGAKPYPLSLPAWFPNFFLLSVALFAAFAIYLIAATQFPQQILGRPLGFSDEWMKDILPPVLIGIVLELGIWFYFRKMIDGDRKLGTDGGLIGGELVAAKIKAAKGGNYLQAECRFTSPQGQVVTGKKNVGRPDRRLKNGPPAGSKILILYDSDRLWRVL